MRRTSSTGIGPPAISVESGSESDMALRGAAFYV
jgi:hypothetical protein